MEMAIDSFCWIPMMHHGICIPWITLFSDPQTGLYMNVPLLRLCQDYRFCPLQRVTKWTELHSNLTPEVLWTPEAFATKTYCTLGVQRGFPLAPNSGRFLAAICVRILGSSTQDLGSLTTLKLTEIQPSCISMSMWDWRRSRDVAFPYTCGIGEYPEMNHSQMTGLTGVADV